MFSYYLRLGFANLRRNPVLTGLLLLTLAVGVAASMSSYTVLHAMSGDPLPDKSDRVLSVIIDTRGAQSLTGDEQWPNQVTYRDASGLKRQGGALRQTALYGISQGVRSERDDLPPFFANGLAVHADFFPIFGLDFLQGSAWDATQDEGGARVAVATRSLAERVFGSVEAAQGQSLNLGGEPFRVVGVVENWQPLPRFYRVAGNTNAEELFLPFGTAIAMEMGAQGSINCSAEGADPGFEGLKRSECVWLSYWAELASVDDLPRYQDGLTAYVAEQRRNGRLPRESEGFRAYAVMDWLSFLNIVGNDTRLQAWLAFGFLLVCLVNTIGLMLAKFGGRAGEVGVRRALGAPRRQLFAQFLTEAGVVGLVGGVVGVLFTLGALWLMGRQSTLIAPYARMDMAMLGMTVGVSLLGAIAAGLLPTWRACNVRPAVQLKSQ